MNPPSLALCAIGKDEALYVEEWLAFHVLQGVAEFLIFDNGSSDETRALAARAGREARVSVVDWPGDDHDAMQRAAYEDGARRLAGRADWVAFVDVDEFLCGRPGLSLPAELEAFGPEVGAVAVGHRIFGAAGEIGYRPDLVTTRFTRCAGPRHEQGRWFKTIARPERIASFDSVHSVRLTSGSYVMADHGPLTRDPDWHPGHASRVGPGNISLNHYMVKSRQEFGWKQRRFAGKRLEHRYTDAFFDQHSAIGDEVECLDLARFGGEVRRLMARWRGDADLAPASRRPRTFPLFDGLVARRDPDPSALFREVEARSGRAGLAAKRAAAEALLATGPHSRREAYGRVAADMALAPDEAERLIALELAIEEASLAPVAEAVARLGPEEAVLCDLAHDNTEARGILERVCRVSPDRPIRRRIGARRELLAAPDFLGVGVDELG